MAQPETVAAPGWTPSPHQPGAWSYRGPWPPPEMPAAMQADMNPHTTITALRAENERLRAGLRELASQLTRAEMDDDQREHGDIEYAYDKMIAVAREALNGTE